MLPKDADRVANSEDPGQTAPRGVCSGSALFVQPVCPDIKNHYDILPEKSIIIRKAVLCPECRFSYKTPQLSL